MTTKKRVRTPRRYKALTASPEKIHQAAADDVIHSHRTDDQCAVAHEVDRVHLACGRNSTIWCPLFLGYWCRDCLTCFDLKEN